MTATLPEPPVPADARHLPIPLALIRACAAQFYGDPPPDWAVHAGIETALAAGFKVGGLQ